MDILPATSSHSCSRRHCHSFLARQACPQPWDPERESEADWWHYGIWIPYNRTFQKLVTNTEVKKRCLNRLPEQICIHSPLQKQVQKPKATSKIVLPTVAVRKTTCSILPRANRHSGVHHPRIRNKFKSRAKHGTSLTTFHGVTSRLSELQSSKSDHHLMLCSFLLEDALKQLASISYRNTHSRSPKYCYFLIA